MFHQERSAAFAWRWCGNSAAENAALAGNTLRVRAAISPAQQPFVCVVTTSIECVHACLHCAPEPRSSCFEASHARGARLLLRAQKLQYHARSSSHPLHTALSAAQAAHARFVWLETPGQVALKATAYTRAFRELSGERPLRASAEAHELSLIHI